MLVFNFLAFAKQKLRASAFGHQLETLVVISTVGSKMLPPRTEDRTSVAVGLFSFSL